MVVFRSFDVVVLKFWFYVVLFSPFGHYLNKPTYLLTYFANALTSVQINSTTSVVYVTPLILNCFNTGILHNLYHVYHVLQALLIPPADHNYNLRDRPNNRHLPDRMSHLTNCNFAVRMLFCDSYWLYSSSCILSVSVYNCVLTGLELGGGGGEPPVHVYRHPFLSENRLWISIPGQNFKHFGSWPQLF